MNSILSLLSFTDEQRRAVTAQDADVAVTAGAGSGKTRALVGRYLGLLEAGLPPRSVVAITFTEKAAREMRTRIRQLIQRWLNEAPEDVDRSRWEAIYAELDAAPIGTIHSLCATILRTHPAEAGIDPAFEVLDEGVAAAQRAQAVESALVWAANDPEAASLFPLLTENGLRQCISTLLENRLDATAVFDVAGADLLDHWRSELRAEIARFLNNPAVHAAVDPLEVLRADGTLTRLSDDTLAAAIKDFFSAWDASVSAWEAGDVTTALEWLPEARRAMLPHKGRKSNWPNIDVPREALSDLRSCYEDTLADLLKHPPDWSLDRQAAGALPHLRKAFETARDTYTQAKGQRHALDFDDLEAGAVTLLENHPDARTYWQTEIHAVLVDEFQDTNDRQRRIIYTLTGFDKRSPTTGSRSPAAMFVVGDAKQSIYRFRGADVTVFREVQRDVENAGGQIVDLDLTFRTHQPLLQQINALLGPIMGTEEDTQRPYAVPFASLRAYRSSPRDAVCEPYVEFCLGLGETATEGREAAAGALARRLWDLHDEEGIDWGEIGLLFRASTSFPDYEDALEQAGIPFVTVAGRGFYDRPEVRDLLNALRAIANPTDNRALAGVLRSPAFALTDGALYLLRRDEEGYRRSMWTALHGDLARLDDEDRARSTRARQIVRELNALAGRTTVAQVLKRFLDLTHYLAILRSPLNGEPAAAGGERVRRNVDKLLVDAHASRLVSIGEFLEYLQTLRDVAAREGEAPVEAGDAVQLMTVHKAKGLEFPVVVIADAGHSGSGRTPHVLLDPGLGSVLKLRGDDDSRSVVYRLAALRDRDREDAEERRLLYVAATRAREKLLISGHVKASTAKSHPGKLLLQGWLKQLGEIVGLDQVRVEETLDGPASVGLPEVGGYPVGCSISPKVAVGYRLFDHAQASSREPALSLPKGSARGDRPPAADSQSVPESVEENASDVVFPPPLLPPVTGVAAAEEIDETLRAREAEPPPRVWRVVPTAERPRGPAWVVGMLVHQALRRWCFPDEDGFDDFLRLYAREAGLTDETELDATLVEARRLLSRFQEHRLYAEIDGTQHYHEVPYTIDLEGQVTSGKIDVLYQRAGRWHIVDFRTDEIRDANELRDKTAKYTRQAETCIEATRRLLNAEPEARLCFLDVAGHVEVAAVAVC